MKKYARTVLAAVFLLVLSFAAVYFSYRGKLAFSGQDMAQETQKESADETGAVGQAEKQKRRDIYCTILGDSIAKGYSGDKSVWIECYGRIAVREMAEAKGCKYRVVNYARNGLSSQGLNEKILKKDEVKKDLARSNVILITVGSNDLLNECKSVVQNILKAETKFKSADQALEVLESSVKKNPLLLLSVIDALGDWDYREFELQWVEMMETIRNISGEQTQIIVTNIYNPVDSRKLPSTMNQVVDDIIGNMNGMIQKHAGKYRYSVADAASSAVSSHVQKDGLHPDQAGQRILAKLVSEQYHAEYTE